MIGNYDIDYRELWVYAAFVLGGYLGYTVTVKSIKPEPGYADRKDGYANAVNDGKATLIVAVGSFAGAAVAAYATAKVVL